jgi:hypothetical protein
MKRRSEMQFKRTAAALLVGAAAVGLFGCDESSERSVPAARASQASPAGTPPAVAADTTPKASDVFKTGAPPAQTSTNAQRTDASHELTRQEESTAMPMPGQANDHSTLAKDPAKR